MSDARQDLLRTTSVVGGERLTGTVLRHLELRQKFLADALPDTGEGSIRFGNACGLTSGVEKSVKIARSLHHVERITGSCVVDACQWSEPFPVG